MRTAVLMLTSKFGKPTSVLLRLDWQWQLVGNDLCFWSCAPGYLGTSAGLWSATALAENIKFYDHDDNLVGWCDKVNCDYTGYPFSDLVGATGPFMRLGKPGGILDTFATWRFLSV